MPVEDAAFRVWFWFYMPLEDSGNGTNCVDVFKKTWVRLMKPMMNVVGINWTWQSIDSISIKSPWGGGR